MTIKPWDSSAVDHSFMGLGGLYNTVLSANMEACRRFGAEKAFGAIGTALYADKDTTVEGLIAEMYLEDGVTASNDDVEFLAKFVEAKALLGAATKILKEAAL